MSLSLAVYTRLEMFIAALEGLLEVIGRGSGRIDYVAFFCMYEGIFPDIE